MQNEESTYPNQKYSFSFLGEIDNIYSFQTQNGYVYEVLFRPTPYLFGAESLYSSFVYELIIRVAKNNSNKKRPRFGGHHLSCIIDCQIQQSTQKSDFLGVFRND